MFKSTQIKTFALAGCLAAALGAQAQFGFTNSNSLITTATHSGCAISVADINHDGLDDIVKMDQSKTLVIDMQNQNGTYTHYNLGSISGANVWGMAVGDVDHNGWMDVATGANGTMYLVKLGWSGSTITKTTTTLAGSYFVQNITWGDFDNDGWLDLAVCDDNDYMKIYKNTAGTLNVTTTLINTNINPGMSVGSDPYDSGNYGSVWLDIDNDGDLDLYIAHCRQAASSYSDVRRRDRLFINDGTNHYTENHAMTGIEPSTPTAMYRQTWTSSFGDLDNDGDQDVVLTNHGENSQIYMNNGSGVFTDVTASSGFSTSFDAIESTVEDFDNDGWLDILVSGPGLVMYKNNHDGTFSQLTGVFGGAMTSFLSFATGDLNHDGFTDLVASYGNVYNTPTATADVLWLNNKNSNHFIDFDLTGVASNHNAIGAKVTIHGTFGTQVREVRSGDSYGTSNSLLVHFGLGAATGITSATIDWPSGATTNFGVLAANQFVTAVEGGCTITGNVIPGPFNLCTGQTLNLTAASGFASYAWNTGATTQTITTGATGNFNVSVSNGGCVNVSPSVSVVLNPDETPTVSTSGVNYCEGVATLTSSPAASYSWSGPSGFTATTQSITPALSGTYSVTIAGTCANFTSAPTTITILAAPTPVGTGATGPGPASFNLSASGSGTLNWYDAPTGGTLVGTGTGYTTPTISTTTTYYVDQTTTYPGALVSGGRPYSVGAGTSTVVGGLDFNVTTACTLASVKVFASTAGTKTIQLKDNTGSVINTYTTAAMATGDSLVVNLNFPLAVGTGYRLTSNVTPGLLRNNSGVSYPYNTSGYLSITNGWTGTTTSSTAYYYYYDWKIQTPSTSCTSARVPVTATVTTATGISSLTAGNGVLVYPNPASDVVNISFQANMSGRTTIELIDVTGRVIRTAQVEDATQGQIIPMDVNTVRAGSYMISIKSGNSNLIQKLVLTK